MAVLTIKIVEAPLQIENQALHHPLTLPRIVARQLRGEGEPWLEHPDDDEDF